MGFNHCEFELHCKGKQETIDDFFAKVTEALDDDELKGPYLD